MIIVYIVAGVLALVGILLMLRPNHDRDDIGRALDRESERGY